MLRIEVYNLSFLVMNFLLSNTRSPYPILIFSFNFNFPTFRSGSVYFERFILEKFTYFNVYSPGRRQHIISKLPETTKVCFMFLHLPRIQQYWFPDELRGSKIIL